jgi:hypothetical protein
VEPADLVTDTGIAFGAERMRCSVGELVVPVVVNVELAGRARRPSLAEVLHQGGVGSAGESGHVSTVVRPYRIPVAAEIAAALDGVELCGGDRHWLVWDTGAVQRMNVRAVENVQRAPAHLAGHFDESHAVAPSGGCRCCSRSRWPRRGAPAGMVMPHW